MPPTLCHFGHTGQALQFVFEEGILNCAQFVGIVAVMAIYQGIFEHPAYA